MTEKTQNPLWRWVVLHVVVIAALAGGLLALTRFKSDGTDNGVKQVYIVRHAEKLTGAEAGHDPALSAVGKKRADILAALLHDKNIRHIFTTTYIRTRQTAGPLAKANGIRMTFYDPRDLDKLAKLVKAAKGNSLIVGHSNTIRETVQALGGTLRDDPIDEAREYDRLYRVELEADGPVKTHLQRFGKRYTPQAR